MNTRTTESLAGLRAYWESLPVSPISEEEIGLIDKLVEDPPELTNPQWEEFFGRMSGPEGCDFKEGDEGITWTCKGGNDKSFATAILTRMGVSEHLRERVLSLVDVLGGHCDCEILFNAQERILEEEKVGAS